MELFYQIINFYQNYIFSHTTKTPAKLIFSHGNHMPREKNVFILEIFLFNWNHTVDFILQMYFKIVYVYKSILFVTHTVLVSY